MLSNFKRDQIIATYYNYILIKQERNGTRRCCQKKETAKQTQTFECPNKENSSEVQPKTSDHLKGRRR